MEVCYTACYTVYGSLLLLSFYYYCQRDGAHIIEMRVGMRPSMGEVRRFLLEITI